MNLTLHKSLIENYKCYNFNKIVTDVYRRSLYYKIIFCNTILFCTTNQNQNNFSQEENIKLL